MKIIRTSLIAIVLLSCSSNSNQNNQTVKKGNMEIRNSVTSLRLDSGDANICWWGDKYCTWNTDSLKRGLKNRKWETLYLCSHDTDSIQTISKLIRAIINVGCHITDSNFLEKKINIRKLDSQNVHKVRRHYFEWLNRLNTNGAMTVHASIHGPCLVNYQLDALFEAAKEPCTYLCMGIDSLELFFQVRMKSDQCAYITRIYNPPIVKFQQIYLD